MYVYLICLSKPVKHMSDTCLKPRFDEGGERIPCLTDYIEGYCCCNEPLRENPGFEDEMEEVD